MPSISERINRLFEEERWPEARKELVRALNREPGDHWLMARLATTYYEERDYRKALEIALAAKKIKPTCPLVLWELAGALHMTGKPNAALRVYRELVQRGWRSIANDECGEGEDWAISLLIDSLFRMGVCYQQQGKKRAALRAYRKHVELRTMGGSSIYPMETVEKRIQAFAGDYRELLVRELAAVRKAGA